MATYRDVMTGLEIFAKHEKPSAQVICAAHEQIWAGELPEGELSGSDLAALDGAGWFWDETAGSWSRFV